MTATDGGGLTYDQGFTLTVAAGDGAPTAVADRARTRANEPVTIDVIANDGDPAGRPLAVDGVTEPAHGASAIADGKVTYTPAFGFVGADAFTYTVANDLGLADTAEIAVRVDGQGEPFADGTWFTDGTGWSEADAAA